MNLMSLVPCDVRMNCVRRFVQAYRDVHVTGTKVDAVVVWIVERPATASY
jgi:isocitrate/isopropylmalate dehydrogenase